MSDPRFFTKDELRLINQQARRALEPYWEHVRSLMLEPALEMKRANGGELSQSDLRRLRVTVQVDVEQSDD